MKPIGAYFMLILEDLKDKVQELDVLLKDYLPEEDASGGR